MHVLILGGTSEALALGRELSGHARIRATLSLAGRTRRPVPAGLPMRSGGFGGVDGLVDWLEREAVQVVVDATHPFAVRMSANAAAACRRLGLPLAQLTRPPWTPEPGEHWYHAPDLAGAARVLTQHPELGPRVLLTTGRTTLSRFEAVPDRVWFVRCVDPPEPTPAFEQWTLIHERGPFDPERERALFREHGIDVLVTKNAGGAASRPKLDVARALGVPVVMVDRSDTGAPVDRVFHEPAAVRAWLEDGATHEPAPESGQG